ncbi:hypothetical protein GCM10011589_35820 [Modestobacter marinus]|uniref:Uncharacterized protein n=1 Tax=Modestobacter marinus TaxID=477641 RepID=A0ABQ2G5J6_9ACTN|nr:hypothetical protein GCM10011589_35820 [Modestobacter marinus]
MTEQPTGHPRRRSDASRQGSGPCSSSTSTASYWRRCVPERILLCLRTREHGARQGPGTEPLPVPAPLADRVALAAVQRLLTALTPAQSRGSERGRLPAADGRICKGCPPRTGASAEGCPQSRETENGLAD